MSARIQRNQALPADFAGLLGQMHGARDPRLPMTLSLAKLNGWTLTALATPLGVTRERVRQIVAKATMTVGDQLPEVPLPSRKPASEPKAPRRRLLVRADLAEKLREMAAVASTVNGATPTDAPARKVSEEFTAMLASLVEQGVTVYHLAQVLDTWPSAITQRLARHGYRKAAPSQEHIHYLGHPTKGPTGTQENCKRGHPLSGENLYVIPKTGQRICRQCHKLRHLAYRERKRLAEGGGAR